MPRSNRWAPLHGDAAVMKISAVINAEAGTMRSLSRGDVRTLLDNGFTSSRHELASVVFAAPDELDDALNDAIENADGVLVGGGDGTISSAAATVRKAGKTLGILPLGTFNLFARSFGIPLEPEQAIASLARSTRGQVDVGDLNSRLFLHHVTFGLHPDLVRLRNESADSTTRAEKMLASASAWWEAVRSPAMVSASITTDQGCKRIRSPLVVVANNRFSEQIGVPAPENPSEGTLAIYTCQAETTAELIEFSVSAALGNWTSGPRLDVDTGERVSITAEEGGAEVSMDGELERFENPFDFRSIHKGLDILIPARPA